MSGNIKRNNYYIDEQNNIVTFKIRNAYGTAVSEFVADADDLDVLACITWDKTKGADNDGTLIYGSNGESVLQTIGNKYVYANNECKLFLVRMNINESNYCKTNLVCVNKSSEMVFGQLTHTKKLQNKSIKFTHVQYRSHQGGVYVASMRMKFEGVFVKHVSKSFGVHVNAHAKERAIYAAYLFEKQFYGNNFPEEEYARKEEAFKVLDGSERAEVENVIVEQLETLGLARKKIDKYYESRTLAAKLTSGEVIVRPDLKIDNAEESDDVFTDVELEPEPESESESESESEHDIKDCAIKCSKKLLTDTYKKQSSNQFIHVYRKTMRSRQLWSVIASLPKYRTAFTVDLSARKYTNAKALAIYAAYLFEKLAYGDNFPKTEYDRKLEVVKTLSTDDIDFVNDLVAPKLEKVYNILKEMAYEKSAENEKSN